MSGIHNPEKSLKYFLSKIENSETSEINKKNLFDFKNECIAQGLSIHRVVFYLVRLMVITRMINKNFRDMNKDDIRELVVKIQTKENYSENTKADYKKTVKKFFQWLEGLEWKCKKYPEKVEWISTSIKNNKKKLPDELLTQDEIKEMIKNAKNSRDKALISVLYESGCRIGELLEMKTNQVQFDNYGVVMMVYGKTGSRRVRLISSVPSLSRWLQDHTNPNNGSHLWVNRSTNNRGQRLSYTKTVKLLKEVAKLSGIEKPVNPHMFRHSRATYLANKLTEAQMKEYFGWTQNSGMASVYVHMSGRDVDNAILKMYGKVDEKDEKEEEAFKPKVCPRCDHVNSPESDFCIKCRLPLTEKAAIESDKTEKMVLSMITPEMIEKMIEKKVKELIKDSSQ